MEEVAPTAARTPESSPGSGDLHLVVGDPQSTRATFTRFILPVAWERDPSPLIGTDAPRFVQATAGDWMHSAGEIDTEQADKGYSRRKYYGPETNALLYKRATWFVLRDPSAGDRKVWRKGRVRSGVGSDPRAYTLAVRPPALVLFESKDTPGVDTLSNGFLILDFFFPNPADAPTPADLLVLNEVARYWRCPFPGHAAKHWPLLRDLKKLLTGDRWLPEDEPRNESDERGGLTLSTRYVYEHRWMSLLDMPIEGGLRIGGLGNPASNDVFPPWMINPDDRAFTLTFAALETGVEPTKDVVPAMDLKQVWGPTDAILKACAPGKVNEGWWLRLLNVDRVARQDFDLNTSDFEREWLKKRTYTRWLHYGTLYGFSEHSFAALCGPGWEEGDDKATARRGHGEPELAEHAATLYTDMTLLVLYLRCTIFRLSASLHGVSCTARDRGAGTWRERRRVRKAFGELRWQFFYLENLYQFPVLSNQQQHLEMFAKQREILDIAPLYDEVAKEIRAGDELFENVLMEERNRHAEMLNVVGAWVAVFGLSLGLIDGARGAVWSTAFTRWVLDGLGVKGGESLAETVILFLLGLVIFGIPAWGCWLIYRWRSHRRPSKEGVT